jgi:hypothetical protein
MNTEAFFHLTLDAVAFECWLETLQCAQASEARFQHLKGKYEQMLVLNKQHGGNATTQSCSMEFHNLNKQHGNYILKNASISKYQYIVTQTFHKQSLHFLSTILITSLMHTAGTDTSLKPKSMKLIHVSSVCSQS